MDDYRLGLRHRAGLGVTDATDAIAVIVSEERGTISVANNGDLLRNIDPDELEHTVLDLYPASMRHPPGLLQGIQAILKGR
jgi:diadenylate cyclase